MAQSVPSATLGTIITAAASAQSSTDGSSSLGSGWTLIPTSTVLQSMSQSTQNTFSNYDLSSQVYVNTQTGEVIIANRGTQLSSAGNLLADSGIMANTITSLFGISSTTSLQNAANAFAEAGLAAAKQVLQNSGKSLSAVYTAGYSLGGTESQFQAADLSTATGSNGAALIPAGVNLVNVSLDSPGIGAASTSGNTSKYTSYDIYTQGDIIHQSGGSQLAGTVGISLPVGPTSNTISLSSVSSFFSTAADEASTAVSAHAISLIQQNVVGSSMGNISMSNTQSLQQLGSMSSSQIQNLLVPGTSTSSTSSTSSSSSSTSSLVSAVTKVASTVGSFLSKLFSKSSSSSSSASTTTTPTTKSTTTQTLSSTLTSTANALTSQLVQAAASYAPSSSGSSTTVLTSQQSPLLLLSGSPNGR